MAGLSHTYPFYIYVYSYSHILYPLLEVSWMATTSMADDEFWAQDSEALLRALRLPEEYSILEVQKPWT